MIFNKKNIWKSIEIKLKKVEEISKNGKKIECVQIL